MLELKGGAAGVRGLEVEEIRKETSTWASSPTPTPNPGQSLTGSKKGESWNQSHVAQAVEPPGRCGEL